MYGSTEKDEITWKQSYLFTRELSEDLQTCELEYFYELDLDELAYAGLTLEIEGTCGNSHFFEKTECLGIGRSFTNCLGESEAVVAEKNRRTKLNMRWKFGLKQEKNAPCFQVPFPFRSSAAWNSIGQALPVKKGRENSVSL